jgi:hypothetical protein
MAPTYLRIPWGTSEATQAGILHDSVVSCPHLATVHVDRMQRVIGRLPDAVMLRIDECLKATLGLRSPEPLDSILWGCWSDYYLQGVRVGGRVNCP